MSLTFYLGTHETGWMARPVGPLFVSHRRLARRKRLPRAAGRWALDSGAFTELLRYGRWMFSAEQYVDAARRYSEEIGELDFAFAMDWLCEPAVLARTGLGIAEHQRRTVENFLQLRSLAPDVPFAPVLQGWSLRDFLECAELYRREGIDIAGEPLVGVGSISSRQGNREVREILSALAEQGLALHGFGVKHRGLAASAGHLCSADSMAWSLQARYEPPLPHCRHARCSNCLHYAVRWRERLLAELPLRANRSTSM
jgi:hypothetical protein